MLTRSLACLLHGFPKATRELLSHPLTTAAAFVKTGQPTSFFCGRGHAAAAAALHIDMDRYMKQIYLRIYNLLPPKMYVASIKFRGGVSTT